MRSLLKLGLQFLCLCAFLLPAPAPAKAEVHLWPLLELDDEHTTVLYPFYVNDDRFMMMFPVYYRLKSEGEHHIAWPLVKIDDGRLARVAPVWFSDKEGEFTLFPLIWKRQSGTLMLLPPMSLGPNGELEAIFPFFARSSEPDGSGGIREDLQILWPLYSKNERRTSEGALISRSRRWLLFSDSIDSSGTYSMRILGIPVSERFRRQ